MRAVRQVSLTALCLTASCWLLRVGPTSLTGTEALEAAPKPPPLDSEFRDCGPAGSQPDYALNRRKDRIDEGDYLPVPWTMIARLPWPPSVDYRFRNQWRAGDTREVARYEGVAVEVEGYLAAYRLEIPEPPNCYRTDAADRDFHLWLSRAPHQHEKESIVVEITPRVRVLHPGWTADRIEALVHSQARVRVRGWLMLDQMHPENVDRNRRTLWEVHPILHLAWRRADGHWVALDSLGPHGPHG